MSNTSSLPNKSSQLEVPELPYNPQEYPRENARHYVSASDEDINEMLAKVGNCELKISSLIFLIR